MNTQLGYLMPIYKEVCSRFGGLGAGSNFSQVRESCARDEDFGCVDTLIDTG